MQYPGNSFQPDTYISQGMPTLESPKSASPFTPSQSMFSYNCNFLEQLQGIFEMETCGGVGMTRIHVLKPMFENYQQRAVVKLSRCTDGAALPDQLIIEEIDRFILYSWNQEAVAYMFKGVDMKDGLKWKSVSYNFHFTWKRIGQVSFNFVSATSLLQGNNKSSPIENLVVPWHYSDNHVAIQDTPQTATKRMDEEFLLDKIKCWCRGRPNLLKKVVQWGLSTDMMLMTDTPKKISSLSITQKLAKGRLWVSCSMPSGHGKDLSPAQDAINNLKGAYQEINPGVFVQPKPKVNEPGTQHRLRKVKNLWIIEECDKVRDSWKLRVQQQSRRRWIDVNGFKPIQIMVTPLACILERMVGETLQEDIAKQIEFLFRTCNQKKLNTKLKKRNIKHNIMNLNMQLQKQNNLSFAVRVVNKADEIAKECGIYS